MFYHFSIPAVHVEGHDLRKRGRTEATLEGHLVLVGVQVKEVVVSRQLTFLFHLERTELALEGKLVA